MSEPLSPLFIPWDEAIASELMDAMGVRVAQRRAAGKTWADIANEETTATGGVVALSHLMLTIYAAGRVSGAKAGAEA